MAEAIKTEKTENFDVSKALNTENFGQFLAAHPDAETFDMGDEEAIKSRMEVFNTKERVKKEVKELYSKQIQQEMGIKLEKSELALIDAHFEKKAIENPEVLLGFMGKLNMFRELPVQVKGLEEQLGQLGKMEDLAAKLNELRQDKGNIEKAQEYSGLIGKTKFAGQAIDKLLGIMGPADPDSNFRLGDILESRNARKAVEGKYGKDKDKQTILAGVEEEIAKIETSLAGIQEGNRLREQAVEMYGDARKELLGEISGITELTFTIKSMAWAQLRQLTKTGSIKSLDQAQERFEALKVVAQSTETGFDPTEMVNEKDFQERINIAMETRVSEEVMQAITRANLGANSFTRLEKTLEPFLKREKIGSKEGDEARDFLRKTLEEASANLGDTNEDKTKKLFISRILITMKK